MKLTNFKKWACIRIADCNNWKQLEKTLTRILKETKERINRKPLK